METRRTILISTIGVPFMLQAAIARGNSNSELLKCTMSLNKSTVKLDGDFTIVCTLEARLKFCRIYAPLSWGDVRGFKLKLVGADGKATEPQFHPPVAPPAAFDNVRFHELDVGEAISFRSTLQAKSVFPSSGIFKLTAIYIPEPLRAATHVQNAILFENGPVESGATRVTAV
jgi:hypothetical protein